MFSDTKRFSDDAIYLNKPKQADAKEIFVFFGDLIDKLEQVEPLRIFDVGCAAGELIYYLNPLLSRKNPIMSLQHLVLK